MKRQGLRLDTRNTYICRSCGYEFFAKLKKKNKVRCSDCIRNSGRRLDPLFVKKAKEYENKESNKKN